MRNLNATYKGLITGLIMALLSLTVYSYGKNYQSGLQYINYVVFALGITWALVSYSNMPHAIRTFRNYFSQGFKCFVVVTLVMVCYTYILIKSDPSLREESATSTRIFLEKKGNYTPDEINQSVENARQYFVTVSTSTTIFRYLVLGALITAVVSWTLIKRKGANMDQEHTSFTGTKI